MEQCPICASKGRDISKDNLGVYSDGHTWCFRCSKPTFSEKGKIKNFIDQEQIGKKEQIFLPEDCTIKYPDKCLAWAGKYGLTETDLLRYNTFWSPSEQRLIFPFYENGNLLGYQGRSFKENNPVIGKIPKWFGKGITEDVFNILGIGNILVLCEDIVSAIKIAKAGYASMPLYGSSISQERFKRLYKLFGSKSEVVIWLDYDKASEAPSYSKLGGIYGLSCRTIVTEQDPKEYSIEEIQEILE